MEYLPTRIRAVRAGWPPPRREAAVSSTSTHLSSGTVAATAAGCFPPGPPASPAQQAAVTAHAVKFAECMRAHGVPGFADPGVSPGGGKLPGPGYFVQAQSGPLSPDNPQFVKAQKSCQTLTGGLY